MNSYSQNQEDRWIVENLKLPDRGIFCEVGAYDGVLSSNTLLFEQGGWDGILFEGDPVLADRARMHRKARVLCCAIGMPRIADFHINTLDRGLSGLDATGDIVMSTIVVGLRSALEILGIDRLDLLSIDTEGTELDVWESFKGFPLPPIVIIEHQTCDRPSNKQPIIDRLTKDGYKLVHTTQYNLIFTL